MSAQIKNPKGPPRKLYSVEFADPYENDGDHYDDDDSEDIIGVESLPVDDYDLSKEESLEVGDELFVLGSNDTISVGTITSVAEKGSSGATATLGLALVRRAESIFKKMAELGIETDEWLEAPAMIDEETILRERELALMNDPLHRLEVVVKGKWIHGRLNALKILRPNNKEDDKNFSGNQDKDVVEDATDMDNKDTDVIDAVKALEEAEKAAKEAEAAAKEAERKAQKMEMLRKRAEAAVKARNAKRSS